MRAQGVWVAAFAATLSGCGLGPAPLPEVWDRIADPDATFHMEKLIKNAIWCELKKGVAESRGLDWSKRYYDGKQVSGNEDAAIPDSWGVLAQLTIQADEKSSFTPGVSFKTPIHNAPVNFSGETIGASALVSTVSYGPLSLGQSYSLGLGGQLSSENTHYHKYNFYYSAKDLGQPEIGSTCNQDIGANSASSPFVDGSNLAIREWLTSAVRVIDFHRSSRTAADGEGPPEAVQGTASDSSQYDNKFLIITEGSISPSWNLVRIGTPSTPLFDANRTRTHELLLTLAPGAESFKIVKTTKGKKTTTATVLVNSGPSRAAIDAHNAALIGSAVANALRAP
jgi:hypothetical protein